MTLGRYCTSCGQPISAASASCPHCGSAVHRSCPSCGAANSVESRFCAACGALQTASSRVAETPETQGAGSERREVTVVFVDATDFTATSSRLDVEDVYLFIDEALKLLADVVAEYEGTIDKFTGDGLMALFGAPLAHEDDAERAVRAAWEMQRVIRPFRERLRAQHGFEFRIRIGVHTGEVIAGRLGGRAHAEYTAIGDTVNLASRLQAAAEPDSVLVSQATYDSTSANFEYESLPPLTLKGFSGGIRAWRLAGVMQQTGALRGVPGLQVPLIGREAPLASLRQSARNMLAARAMWVTCVSGEAGVGKSRLVQEALDSDELSAARVIATRCIALTRSRPLGTVADLIRRLIGTEETDLPAAQMEAVRAFAVTHLADQEDPTPYLAFIVGAAHTDPAIERRLAGLTEEMLRDQIQLSVRAALVAEAKRQPLVVVVDDLHWIDSVSRDCLAYLAASCADEPLLLLLVTRQSERETLLEPLLRTAAGRRGELVDILLEPLNESDARRLVRQMVRGEGVEAQRLRQRIIARAEGNPFYVEELVRMLADRGGLVGAPGEWTPAPDAERLLNDVPSSLRGIIITRFDALPQALRYVLQRAAVLGRSFPVSLLEQLVDADADVGEMLAELERREFLTMVSFGLERGYTFGHVLVQEAIHSTILKRDRQELHRHVAEAVESGAFWSAAERNEALAYHWAESAEPARAVPYLLAVAESSARRHANDAAIDRCTRALSILRHAPDDDMEVRALLILGRAMKFQGRLAEGRDTLREGSNRVYARLASDEPDPQRVTTYIDLLRELADVESRAGALNEAAMHLDEAMLAVMHFGAEDLRHTVAERLAWVRFRQGKLEEALLLADDLAKTLAANPDADATLLASVYNTLGGVLWNYGKLDIAAAYVRQSLTLYHRIGYLFGKANAHTNLGVLYFTQGKWMEAAESFERSDWLRRETGCIVGRSTNLLNLGMLRISMGDHAQARADLETSVRISSQLGEELDRIRALTALTQLDVIEEKFDEARARIDDIRAKHFEALKNDDLAQVECLRALVLAESGDVVESIAIATEARRIARESAVPETEADCARALGVLQLRAGLANEGQTTLRESAELAVKVGDPYRQALALLESGMTGEAVNIFAQLGAKHDFERAVATMEGEPRARTTSAPSRLPHA